MPLFDGIPDSDIVVILLGTNDALGFGEPNDASVPPAEFEENLLEIVETLLRNGVEDVVVLISAMPPYWRGTEKGRLISAYSELTPAVCRQTGSTCVDLSVGMPEAGYVEWIHPTVVGHAHIAERLLATLHDLL